MTDYYEQLARLVASALFALVSMLGSPTTPTEYATPCQEDEGWLTVDYRTAGAIEDEKGVSRLCINLERLTIDGEAL